MIGLSIDITKIVKDFQKYGDNVDKAVKRASDDTAKELITDARKRLKGMFGSAKHIITGTLWKSIKRMPQYEKFKDERVVGSDVEYAAYIEFGTGEMVEIPEGAEATAALFKGKGKRKVNIKGDSFLNWAAVNQEKKYLDRLEKELNKINK